MSKQETSTNQNSKNPISNTDRIQLNKIARAHGYNRCTKIVIEAGREKGYGVNHTPYGFSTNSGKFFPYVTTTKWFGSGCYSPAVTQIKLSKEFAQKHFPLMLKYLGVGKEIDNIFSNQ